MIKKSIDGSVNHLLESIKLKNIETVWDRSDQQGPRCGFGELGLCCRNCNMGPCRIDPFKEGAQKGVCGATGEVIVARNFGRMIAAGAAAHSDHGRDVAQALLLAAKNPESGYTIKDTNKLKKVANIFGVVIENRSTNEIAADVAQRALGVFGQQEGEIPFIRLAPEPRQAIWRRLNMIPRGIDREIVEMMHRTAMGVDQEHSNIMLQGNRTALSDGWGGSMIAT